jgi:MFS transporter, SHS family, sialic acid transporter
MSNQPAFPPKTYQRGANMALAAAFLGWLFDGFEMGLFPLIGKPALQDLLPNESSIVQSQWFTVIIAFCLAGWETKWVESKR